MFFCQVTNKASKRGEKLVRLPIKKRERVYYGRVFNEETESYEELEVGRGWEVVKEINTTEEGVALFNSWTPEEQDEFVKEF